MGIGKSTIIDALQLVFLGDDLEYYGKPLEGKEMVLKSISEYLKGNRNQILTHT